jgi:hypothetical protein
MCVTLDEAREFVGHQLLLPHCTCLTQLTLWQLLELFCKGMVLKVINKNDLALVSKKIFFPHKKKKNTCKFAHIRIFQS